MEHCSRAKPDGGGVPPTIERENHHRHQSPCASRLFRSRPPRRFWVAGLQRKEKGTGTEAGATDRDRRHVSSAVGPIAADPPMPPVKMAHRAARQGPIAISWRLFRGKRDGLRFARGQHRRKASLRIEKSLRHLACGAAVPIVVAVDFGGAFNSFLDIPKRQQSRAGR